MSETRRRNPVVWIALVVVLGMPLLGVAAMYPLAIHDVKTHSRSMGGWSPFSDPQLSRIQPSLHHGLWFEFKMTNTYGERYTGYWRLWPWRRAEIYVG